MIFERNTFRADRLSFRWPGWSRRDRASRSLWIPFAIFRPICAKYLGGTRHAAESKTSWAPVSASRQRIDTMLSCYKVSHEVNQAHLPSRNCDLERRVRVSLENRNVHAIRGLDVEAEGTTVRLKGSVKSYYTRQLLVHGCLGVPGVRTVIDEISVAT
jgi:hypothetical protein